MYIMHAYVYAFIAFPTSLYTAASSSYDNYDSLCVLGLYVCLLVYACVCVCVSCMCFLCMCVNGCVWYGCNYWCLLGVSMFHMCF